MFVFFGCNDGILSNPKLDFNCQQTAELAMKMCVEISKEIKKCDVE